MKKTTILKFLLLNFSFAIFIIFITDFFNINFGQSKFEEYFKDYPLLMGFLTIFFVPALEEFAFRYPLIKKKFSYIALIVFSLLMFSIYSDNLLFIIGFGTLNLLTFIFYFFLKKEKLPVAFMFFYALIFSLCHLDNFDNLSAIGISLVIIENLVFSFFTTYIYLKKNFTWTIIYHSGFNLLGMLYYWFVPI